VVLQRFESELPSETPPPQSVTPATNGPTGGATADTPAALKAHTEQVLSLLALLVQKYLLYWYKSTNTDT
jgi:hypothetical protein